MARAFTNGNSQTCRAPAERPQFQFPPATVLAQVGISKGVIEQRRCVEQNARAQVESVCADSSLTQQQKHQKIKELRQQARQQIDAIITPQQQEELKACNAQRATNRPAPLPRPVTGGLGPCA
jgi:hypothetical protein